MNSTTNPRIIARIIAGAVLTLGLAAATAAQDADVAEGEQLYVSQCKVCHGDNARGEAEERAPTAVRWLVAQGGGPVADAGLLAFAPPFGPNLRGIVGRQAGAVPGFDYSKAFLKALTGMTWTEGTLDWWIRDTQAWVPGTLMFYKQKDAEVRRKIVAYLKANP
jgi:cytochrome c2